MLSFIGCGSAFNTELGNNSAYIKEGNVLFLIDCGSSTFSRIKSAGLFEGVDVVKVVVTHAHPDHVGSLGDLIFYSHFVLGAQVYVSAPPWFKITKILDALGVYQDYYVYIQLFPVEDREFKAKDFVIRYQSVKVQHVPYMDCYGYLIEYQGKRIYYSGDCNEIPTQVLELLEKGEIDFFYQDTCGAEYEGNVHLSLAELSTEIHPVHRHKVWCMHLDEEFPIERAKALGFNVVSPVV